MVFAPFSISQEVWILCISTIQNIDFIPSAPYAYSFNRHILREEASPTVHRDAASKLCATLKVSNFQHTRRVRVSPRANAKWWIVSRHRIAFSLMLWERAAALIVDTRCNFSASAANFDKRANIWKDNTQLARLANFWAEKCNSIRWSHSYTNIKHIRYPAPAFTLAYPNI